MEFVGPKQNQKKKLSKTNSLAEWVVHVHRFVDGKPHVRNVGCHHTWACFWSQHMQGCITLLQKSTWDFVNPYTTASKNLQNMPNNPEITFLIPMPKFQRAEATVSC